VYTIAAGRRREEDSHIDERAWYLFDVDTPRVVVGCDFGFPVTVVSVEITERAAPLLNNLNGEHAVVLDPSESVAVVDVEVPADASGNVRGHGHRLRLSQVVPGLPVAELDFDFDRLRYSFARSSMTQRRPLASENSSHEGLELEPQPNQNHSS